MVLLGWLGVVRGLLLYVPIPRKIGLKSYSEFYFQLHQNSRYSDNLIPVPVNSYIQIYSLHREYDLLRIDLAAIMKVAVLLAQETINLRAERDKGKEEVAGWAKVQDECDRLRAELAAKTKVAQTFAQDVSGGYPRVG